MTSRRILGIDPGSRLVGYGIIEVRGREIRHVMHGTLKVANTGGKAVIPLEVRLLEIFRGLEAIILSEKPDILAIERVFFAKNANSSLKLGQARGVAILSGAVHGLEVHEYSASEVKAAVVGTGSADKDQVAAMVKLRLGALEFQTLDASDALAIALCHAQRLRAPQPRSATSSDWKKAWASSSKKRGRSLADALGLAAQPKKRPLLEK